MMKGSPMLHRAGSTCGTVRTGGRLKDGGQEFCLSVRDEWMTDDQKLKHK